MISRLIQSYRLYLERSKRPLLYTDANGYVVAVPKDLLRAAQDADLVDEAALIEDALVWTINPLWHLNIQTLRDVISIAQAYDDIETALMAVVAHTGFHWGEADEMDESDN